MENTVASLYREIIPTQEQQTEKDNNLIPL